MQKGSCLGNAAETANITSLHKYCLERDKLITVSLSTLRPHGVFNLETGEKLFGKIIRSNSVKLLKEILERAKFREDGAFLVQLRTILPLENFASLFLFSNYEYGSLYEVLQRNGSIPLHPAQLTKIIYSMATALDFLHSQELTHGFITTKHCIMDEYGFIRLCGLGNLHLGSKASRSRWAYYTSVGYLAPEVLDENRDAAIDPFLVDMFAFGVILHRCVTGSFPGNDATDEIVFAPSENFRKPPATLMVLPVLNTGKCGPTDYDTVEIQKCVQRLLSKPSMRPRAGVFLHSLWLQNAVQSEKRCSSANALFFN